MEGWIRLHRKLMSSDTFSRLTAVQKLIAIYIILNANHADGVWYDKYKNIEVEIKRGQLVTSRKKIASEWFQNDKDVSEMKIRTCLDKLERIGFLTKSSTNDYTLITVLNYEVYQGSDTDDNQQDNQVLTKSQPSDNQAITTNKNDKNVKNDKKINKKDIIPKIDFSESVKMTQIEHDKLSTEFGLETTTKAIEYLTSYKAEKGYKTKSDYLTIRRWVVEAVNKKGGATIGKHQNGNAGTTSPSKFASADKNKPFDPSQLDGLSF